LNEVRLNIRLFIYDLAHHLSQSPGAVQNQYSSTALLLVNIFTIAVLYAADGVGNVD